MAARVTLQFIGQSVSFTRSPSRRGIYSFIYFSSNQGFEQDQTADAEPFPDRSGGGKLAIRFLFFFFYFPVKPSLYSTHLRPSLRLNIVSKQLPRITVFLPLMSKVKATETGQTRRPRVKTGSRRPLGYVGSL